MKKYLLLLVTFGFFLFASCSDDDDAGGEEHSITATWELSGVTPPIPGLDVAACPENPTITFNENGSTNWTLYDSDNECAEESSTGMWQKNQGNNYTVTIPDFGEVDGTVAFSGANNFTFTTAEPDLPVQFTFSFRK